MKHSSLLGQLVSYEENEVLWIGTQVFKGFGQFPFSNKFQFERKSKDSIKVGRN